jgi:hypothetical protein
MIGGAKGNFETPDENLAFEKISVQIVNLNGKNVKKVTVQPGWNWKEHMSQIAGTEWCEGRPFGVVVSGKYHAQHKDGTEFDILPGEAFIVEPGHNLWVVGDEPVVVYEFE